MDRIVDVHGNVIAEIEEHQYPLSHEVETKAGVKLYVTKRTHAEKIYTSTTIDQNKLNINYILKH